MIPIVSHVSESGAALAKKLFQRTRRSTVEESGGGEVREVEERIAVRGVVGKERQWRSPTGVTEVRQLYTRRHSRAVAQF